MELDPPFVRDRIRGVDDEAPARQPPTRPPYQHRATADVAACADAGCAGDACTEGCGGCARAVVPWRGGSAPLKRAALRRCQTQLGGGDSRPPPPWRQPSIWLPGIKVGIGSTVGLGRSGQLVLQAAMSSCWHLCSASEHGHGRECVGCAGRAAHRRSVPEVAAVRGDDYVMFGDHEDGDDGCAACRETCYVKKKKKRHNGRPGEAA